MIIGDDTELVDAACWFATALGIADLDFELNILMYEKGDANPGSGWIEYADRDADIYLSYDLTDRECILEILAHEMVHLKQYLLGELKDVPGFNLAVWNGEVWPTSNDPRSRVYWESPWEVEAFGRSHGLEYLYKAHLEKKNG